MNMFHGEMGETFYLAAKRAKHALIAQKMSFGYLTFNEIVVTISADSNLDDIGAIYMLKHKLRQKEANVA